MKKFLAICSILFMLLTPLFSGLNQHTYPIFNDWVYDGYNNEGDWVAFDLGTLDGQLNNKQSFVRITLEVTEIDTDGSEYVYLYLREHGGGYSTVRQVSVNYNNGLKGEIECWTDSEGWIDYKIDYGWWESKKVKVMIRIVNSIN
jgi:hypothetical protein